MPKASLALFSLSLTAFVLLGMADSGLGVAWPSMRDFFDRSLADLGLLLAFLSVGYLLASLSFGAVHSRLGTGWSLAAGGLLMSSGLVGLGTAAVWPITSVSAGLIGVGAGLIDVGVNAHAALQFDLGSINLIHAAYGIGATIGPLLITLSLAASGQWRLGYAFFALVQLGIAFMVWRNRARWAGSADTGDPVASSRLRVATLLLIFLIYTGVEVATGQWAFTLLREGRGLDIGHAGFWVSAYWGGLTAGRFAFGLAGDRLPPSRILDGSVIVALAGVGLLWWDPSGIGFLGLPVAGAGFAAIFPTMVALTPARIGRPRSTRMVGYQLAAANLGAASLPWMVGLIAEAVGLGGLVGSLFGLTALLGMLHLWVDRSR